MQSEFISQRIPIAAARSSRWCRAVDAARLLDLGTVRLTPVLDSVFNASEQLADRKQRRNREHHRLEAPIPDRYMLNITMHAADPLMNSSWRLR